MTGLIPVKDKTGERVAAVVWHGSPWHGTGSWQFAGPEVESTIREAVKRGQGLKATAFPDMYADGGEVRGWQGFTGWFQAVLASLSTTGLAVDTANIAWPSATEEAVDATVDSGAETDVG